MAFSFKIYIAKLKKSHIYGMPFPYKNNYFIRLFNHHTSEVMATFQPKDYPEKAYGKNSLTLIDKPYDWPGTVWINQTCHLDRHDSKSQGEGFWTNEESSLLNDHSIHLTLRFLIIQGEPGVLIGKDASGMFLHKGPLRKLLQMHGD